jgi:DNA-binding NarL/FixJ family response regulator
MNGLEATRQILADGSGTRVLILTTFDLDEYVYEALRAGASGFLLKDTLPDELLSAVRVVAGGEALLAPKITTRLIADFVSREPEPSANGSAGSPEPRAKAHPGLETLTDREREVLVAVARGLSNAEIAAELHMSHATAKTHVSRLLTKLHARDRAQLVVLAYEGKLVAPST